MFQRMLVPLDGSEGAERAIPIAARIARASGGSLVFLRVVALPEVAGSSVAGLRGEITVKSEAEASEKDLADSHIFSDCRYSAEPQVALREDSDSMSTLRAAAK